jgi:hypothetical protein
MWVLKIVGALYLVSGFWCGFQPELAASFLGFTLNDIGLSEFVSVYGGLQVGLGLAMLLSSIKPSYLEGAVFFALITSLGLFIFRLIAISSIAANGGVYAMAILEGVIVLALALQFKALLSASHT